MGKEQTRQTQDVAALATQCLGDLMVLDIDEWIERYLAPDFVWDTVPMGLGERTETRAGFRAFYSDWTSAYSDWFIELEQLQALTDELVIACIRQGGRPHGSDQVVELRYGAVSRWHDGMCVSTVNYTTFEDALRAAEALVAHEAPASE